MVSCVLLGDHRTTIRADSAMTTSQARRQLFYVSCISFFRIVAVGFFFNCCAFVWQCRDALYQKLINVVPEQKSENSENFVLKVRCKAICSVSDVATLFCRSCRRERICAIRNDCSLTT